MTKITDEDHRNRMEDRRERQRGSMSGFKRNGYTRRQFVPAAMKPIRAALSRHHPDYDTSPDIHAVRKAERIKATDFGHRIGDGRRTKRGAY